MNIYDKRSSENLLSSRVIKTICTKDCNKCNLLINQRSCSSDNKEKCNNITTQLHLDSGYIVYISARELTHISKAYHSPVDVNQPPELPIIDHPEDEPILDLEDI